MRALLRCHVLVHIFHKRLLHVQQHVSDAVLLELFFNADGLVFARTSGLRAASHVAEASCGLDCAQGLAGAARRLSHIVDLHVIQELADFAESDGRAARCTSATLHDTLAASHIAESSETRIVLQVAYIAHSALVSVEARIVGVVEALRLVLEVAAAHVETLLLLLFSPLSVFVSILFGFAQLFFAGRRLLLHG